jgi:hypothetical protein
MSMTGDQVTGHLIEKRFQTRDYLVFIVDVV